jgi:UDP-2-acetamido-3-amino-2,3-dideoxy-glucuronate N-acetyltransferase
VTIAETAVVYPGTHLGAGVAVGDYAVLGKSPTLGARSTAARDSLGALVVGNEAAILAHAVVFAGTRLGARVVVGDQSCVRERVTVGEETVIGRGAFVENDVVVGARCRIQANAYVTAYSELEDDVFLAPGVLTTNDNFMGRTEKRLALMKGPTIRRGARIGGGAVLLPGIEIGEEAFVGAGAVVTKDVQARMVVVGNPARVMRGVPEDELLENQ